MFQIPTKKYYKGIAVPTIRRTKIKKKKKDYLQWLFFILKKKLSTQTPAPKSHNFLFPLSHTQRRVASNVTGLVAFPW